MDLALTFRRVAVACALALFTEPSHAVTFADGAHHVIDASNSFPGESVVVDDGPGGSQTTVDVLAGGEVATAYEAPAGLIARGRSSIRIAGGRVGNFRYGLELLDDAEAALSSGEVTHLRVGEGSLPTGAPYLVVEGGLVSIGVNLSPGSTALVAGGSVSGIQGGPTSLEITGGRVVGGVSVRGDGDFELSGGDIGWLQIASGVRGRVSDGSIRGTTRLYGLVTPPRTTIEFSGGVFGDDVTATDDADLRITGGVYNGNVAARRFATLVIVGRDFNAPFGEVPRPGLHLIGYYPSGGGFNAVVSQDIGASARIEPDALLLLAIDVLPLSSTNVIRLGQKTVPVAVLGSATADVDHLDLASLRFGDGAAQETHDLTRRGVYAWHRRDWNGDGFADLTLHFRVKESGLGYFPDRACLEGTLEGEPFLACDAVQVRARR